jgi:membrane protein required for colicin V production
MTWVDAAIVVIFLYFIVTAFSAGFVREIVGMAATIFGVVMAGLFYDEIANSLLTSIDNETTADVVGFLIIFVGIAVIGQLIALVVHPAITILQLGIADQLLGAMFGAAKAFIIIEVLLILFVTYPRYDLDTRINDSEFASVMLDVSQPVLKILPDIFEHKVDAFNG